MCRDAVSNILLHWFRRVQEGCCRVERALSGRRPWLQVHYADAGVTDYVQSAVETAVSIHQEDLPGDILIFLTGAAAPSCCRRQIRLPAASGLHSV